MFQPAYLYLTTNTAISDLGIVNPLTTYRDEMGTWEIPDSSDVED
jgi:hypothetical protein